jgi:alginate O-acetyltransferase complex protein AlgI
MTAWERMLLAVALSYVVFKALTMRRMPPARALGYLAFWPGMDARPFTAHAAPAGGERILWGAAKMLLGACLLGVRTGRSELDVPLVFLGLGFLVHFGICDLLCGFWRRRGVAVERLFVNPAASRTLGEFWGRRWNLAFSAVARERVYRPLARRWGAEAGLAGTFLFSGLLHEALISVPAGAGFGAPTAYFLLHGLLLGIERRGGPAGRVWTLFWVLAPLPLLFHPAFVEAIIRPLL